MPHTDEEKLAVIRRLKPEWKEYSSTNRCGVCGAIGEEGRVNYPTPPMQLQTLRGVSIGDFTNMDMIELHHMTGIVADFDRACDRVREQFIELLQNCEVQEEVVMVPKTVRTLRCAAPVHL